MVKCPKCSAVNHYYYDGAFIRCNACGYTEWAETEDNGGITDLYSE